MARRSGLPDRVKAILNANVDRRELNHRTKLMATSAILLVLVPLSAIHFMRKSSNSSSAIAAAPTSQPSTISALSNADEQLQPLPDRLSSKRVPIQVLSPQGTPLRIDSIATIQVWIEPKMPWQDGPTPQILGRYADGWVLVDKEMFARGAARPARRADVFHERHRDVGQREVSRDGFQRIQPEGVVRSSGNRCRYLVRTLGGQRRSGRRGGRS